MQLHAKSLAIRISVLGPQHEDVATSYNSLAGVCLSLGRYEEALELSRKSLDTRINALGAEHPCVADSYTNMFVVLRDQGKLEEAAALWGNLEAIKKLEAMKRRS